MKKVLLFVIVLIVTSDILAQDNSIFQLGEKSNNAHSTGSIWLKEINKPDSVFQFGMAFASFAPNSRLDWHSHPGGQILIITEGVGYYQERGKQKQIVKKGDIIECKPDVEHWHASAPTTTFSYIASSPSQKGKTQWLNPVTEEEYKN